MKKLFLNLLLLISTGLLAQQSETIALQWAKQVDYHFDNYSFKIPQFQPEYFEWDATQKKITFSKFVNIFNLDEAKGTYQAN